MICSQEFLAQLPVTIPSTISAGGIHTLPMLRLSKKLIPRRRKESGKRKLLKDMDRG